MNTNIIEITRPVFLINLDNPRELTYTAEDSGENWKTIIVQNYTFGFPELKENQILFKYTENRGYIHEQTR
jgi:hypothetical protein